MNRIFAYNPSNGRYSLEWEGQVYHYTYDIDKFGVKSVWNEEGKLIAKSYKGFRSKLGIIPASPKASEFVSLLTSTGKITIAT